MCAENATEKGTICSRMTCITTAYPLELTGRIQSLPVCPYSNGIPTTFVVDTGASITILDETFWEKAHCGECSLEPWVGRRLVGV